MREFKKSELSPGTVRGLDRGLLTHAQMQEIARKGGFELPDPLIDPTRSQRWWPALVVLGCVIIIYLAFYG